MSSSVLAMLSGRCDFSQSSHWEINSTHSQDIPGEPTIELWALTVQVEMNQGVSHYTGNDKNWALIFQETFKKK